MQFSLYWASTGAVKTNERLPELLSRFLISLLRKGTASLTTIDPVLLDQEVALSRRRRVKRLRSHYGGR
jgi:hypothetical protein